MIDDVVGLAGRVPSPPGEALPAGASDDELDALEQRLGFALPAELAQWLRRVNGAAIGPGGVFGARGPKHFLGIEHYLASFDGWTARRWIPIAGDGNGEFWVAFPRDGADPGAGVWVGFVDPHEDPDAIVQIVAGGVLSFLRFLFESELGEQRWPYDEAYVLQRDPDLAAAPPNLLPWT